MSKASLPRPESRPALSAAAAAPEPSTARSGSDRLTARPAGGARKAASSGAAPTGVWRVVGTDAEAIERVRSVGDLVRLATSRLLQADVSLGHGTAHAMDEAAWLVCWVLHLPVDRFPELAHAAVMPSEIRATLELLRLRCSSRKPLAYLIGEAWLGGLRFLSDERALVPRSLIAEVLQSSALDGFVDECGEPQAVLDLCCGGGSIAILAARRFAQAQVVGSDLSRPALALARQNLALHAVQDRVELVQGDLFAGLGERRFDLVLCNPPYVNHASMKALPPEYRAEPRAALDGGPDGMDLVERILLQAPDHLQDNGLLVLEIGHELPHFVQRFAALEWWSMEVTQGTDMVVAVQADALRRLALMRTTDPR